MIRHLLFVLLLSVSSVWGAELYQVVARDQASNAIQTIAEDIAALRSEYPQLKEWDQARVTANAIHYSYRFTDMVFPYEGEFGKNGCHLKIWLTQNHSDLDTDTVGIHIKLAAVGKKAESLENAIRQIVQNRVENFRNSHGSVSQKSD